MTGLPEQEGNFETSGTSERERDVLPWEMDGQEKETVGSGKINRKAN